MANAITIALAIVYTLDKITALQIKREELKKLRLENKKAKGKKRA